MKIWALIRGRAITRDDMDGAALLLLLLLLLLGS